ncbi:molecular chaperone HtpG [Vigna unguiculata]|uniref:Molecular chaperone HtpG n=1 Tax=Vigna unguiculata TaxID=3917 RepID=A0A4D6KUK0_VIGUN|nr:molecular chaperone HtpG [Vigna unguiculata]
MANDKVLVLEGEMSLVLRQMNKTFYSNKEIFLQELINNASNALDKIQFESHTNKNILDDRVIRLVPHKANKTLSIIDTGIGMTHTDLAYNLGVGFYSTYLIADKVIVTSKHNDHDQYIWESQHGASFIVTNDINAQQPSRGTNITIFLKDNQVHKLEYLEEVTIKNLVIKYCQHISYRIYLWNENTKDDWQLINIWLHNRERDSKHVAQKLMNHIPDDFVFSILSNLPLKSLKRFGCVRRSWALLFENSHFMNLLRNSFICNHQSYYDDTYLLLNLSPLYQNHYNSSLFSISGKRFENMEKLYWPSQIQEDYIEGIGILGSSSINGIMCLYVKDLVYLWNPTINEFKVIPPSPFENAPYYIYIGIKYHGFGYDCVRDDYKVIRKVSFFVNSDDDVEPHDVFPLSCIWEMYSLRSNSWTNLQLHDCVPTTYDDNNKFYLEGMCHWLGYAESRIQPVISFDLIISQSI